MVESARRVLAWRGLALNAVLVEVVGALEREGVRPLLIKGPGVARWLYDESGERPYKDVDLLVDPDRFDVANGVLERLGFRGLHAGLAVAERTEHAHAWCRARDFEQFVDLHHKIALIDAPPALAWAVLARDARPLRVADAQIDTPRPAALLLIVALHAAQHGRARARSIEDMRRAVARVDVSTWGEAAALAAELGAGSAMREGLQLVEGGVELANHLGLADDASRVVRLLAASAPEAALGVHRLLAARGVAARVRLVARELVPTPAFMRLWHPLASRGPIGLALAYVWRPCWLAAKLPGGVLGLGTVAFSSRRGARRGRRRRS
jgi:putative nucleotidyltransferase-like protein